MSEAPEPERSAPAEHIGHSKAARKVDGFRVSRLLSEWFGTARKRVLEWVAGGLEPDVAARSIGGSA